MSPAVLRSLLPAQMMARMFNNPLTSCKVRMCCEREDTRLSA